MAIEKDSGPGGLIGPQIPETQPDEVLVEELPQDPGIFEFDDGSAIIGEYAEEQERYHKYHMIQTLLSSWMTVIWVRFLLI